MVTRAYVVAALAALVALAACDGGVLPCKQNTVLVSINVAAGVNADSLVLSISLNNATPKSETIPSGASGTVEIDFPDGGYPPGSTFSVDVTAKHGGMQVGFGHAAMALAANCTALPVAVMGINTDGGVKNLGDPCVPGDLCGTGQCVDGYCCESLCPGRCEACDVPGSEGRCVPTPANTPPHSAHPSCAGDQTGPCAGACDGNSRTTCSFPTGACGSPSCAGGMETTTLCAAGTCGSTPMTQTCTLGCLNASSCMDVLQVAAGYSFACAVLGDQSVRCWGDNSAQQIAQFAGDTTPHYLRPVTVDSLQATQLAATFSTFCALTPTQNVQCFGDNTVGQLGLGGPIDTTKHGLPAANVVGVSGATYLGGASGGHFCAIVAGGQILCWGGNGNGQLGDGTIAPVGVPPGKATPTTVCAVGSTATPCAPLTGAIAVAGGDSHTCALHNDGSVACWGSNSQHQLGIATDTANHPFPVLVSGVTATALHSGGNTNCVATGGLAKCWGGNLDGHLGNNMSALGDSATPVTVCTSADCTQLLMGVTQTSGVDEGICAVASGAVRCWGGGESGQLGDGTDNPEAYAATQAIASGAVSVTCGGASAYAIVQNGAEKIVKAWGSAGVGELGDNGAAGGQSKVPISPAW